VTRRAADLGIHKRQLPGLRSGGSFSGKGRQLDTAHFLQKIAPEDLEGGDLEYVEWAGEAELLDGLEAELGELEHAHFQLT